MRGSYMYRIAVSPILLLIAALAGSCSSVGYHSAVDLSEKTSAGSRTVRAYRASFNEVVEAARYAFEKGELADIEEGEEAGGAWYILGNIGTSAASMGQLVKLFVMPEQANEPGVVKVRYASLKRFEINISEDLNTIQIKIIQLMDNHIDLL